jgi:hypothetical protein
MTGFMEKNKYDDDDTVQAGVKHAFRRNLTSPFSGLKMVADGIPATVCKFLPEWSPLLELQTLYYEKY